MSRILAALLSLLTAFGYVPTATADCSGSACCCASDEKPEGARPAAPATSTRILDDRGCRCAAAPQDPSAPREEPKSSPPPPVDALPPPNEDEGIRLPLVGSSDLLSRVAPTLPVPRLYLLHRALIR